MPATISRPRSAARRVAAAALLPALACLFVGPAGAGSPTAGEAAPACPGATVVKATPREVVRYFVSSGKRVLTFVGYAGAGYENPAAMLHEAARVLDRHAPADTLVSIGATGDGIGAVYALAVARGFQTAGIVSSQALAERVPLSPCAGRVFVVEDSRWGGLLDGGLQLTPTSSAVVNASDELVAIGGGEIARDEFVAARRSGRPVRFIPAEMDHRVARERAARKGLPAPTDFRGPVAAVVSLDTPP